MSIEIEIARTPARLLEVGTAWRALWDRAGGEIFQSHEWLATWAGTIAEQAHMKLLVGLAWRGNDLVAVFPCAIERRHGLRWLTWAAQEVSDYCDVLIDSSVAGSTLLEEMWRAMYRAGGFDLVCLLQVRPDARVRRLLDSKLGVRNGLKPEARRVACMRIEREWPDGEAYFRSLNKKARNNHTRGKRILTEMGGSATFRVIGPEDDATDALTRVLQLKRNWAREHYPNSDLLGDGGLALIEMLDSVRRTGSVMIFTLECGDRIAAASVNFVRDSRLQAYFTAYDPAFDRASPGTILIVEYTRWAFDRGMMLVDFLRGDEPFKERLARSCIMLDGYNGGRTWLGHAALALRARRSAKDAAAEPIRAAQDSAPALEPAGLPIPSRTVTSA